MIYERQRILSFIRPAILSGENRIVFITQPTPLGSTSLCFLPTISVQLLKDTTPLTRLASFIV